MYVGLWNKLQANSPNPGMRALEPCRSLLSGTASLHWIKQLQKMGDQVKSLADQYNSITAVLQHQVITVMPVKSLYTNAVGLSPG